MQSSLAERRKLGHRLAALSVHRGAKQSASGDRARASRARGAESRVSGSRYQEIAQHSLQPWLLLGGPDSPADDEVESDQSPAWQGRVCFGEGGGERGGMEEWGDSQFIRK